MLARLTIRSRLVFTLTVLVLATVAVGAVNWRATTALGASAASLAEDALPSVQGLSEASEAFADARFHASQAIVAVTQGDGAQIAEQRVGAEQAQLRIAHGLAAYATQARSAEEAALWDQVEPAMRSFLAENGRVLEAAQGRQVGNAVMIQARMAKRIEGELLGPLARLVELQLAKGDEARGQAQRTASHSARVVLATLVAVALGTAALGLVLVRSVATPIAQVTAEARALSDAVAEGRLAVRAEPARVAAEFRPIVEGMNATLDAFVGPFRLNSDCVRTVAQGRIPGRIEADLRGEFGEAKAGWNELIDVLEQRERDTELLYQAAVDGHLEVRADVTRYGGENGKLAGRINEMLDALTGPLRVSADSLARISRGDLPPPLAADARGDFATIQDNLNTCVASLARLLREMTRVASAHDQGDVDAALDARAFEGAYRAVAEGINAMVAGHVAVNREAMACVAEFGRGNFEAPLERFRGKQASINETVEQVRANLKALVADADRLVQAALDGQLSTRADAARHQGDFRKVVDGVNRTLDAVLAPVREAARVLERLALRDLEARVAGEYRGDHAAIKDSVNATAQALHDALTQVSSAVEQVSTAATQIASSSQAVASGASEQAASLQETAAAVQLLAEQTTGAADHARQASLLAQGARGAAADGAGAVEQLQGAMLRIKHSAEGTSQIIRDVAEIAFQTNLLALNAAVEAARAGDAGRGFAVVAEEVRSLALRAKEAAGKTEELIRQSVRQADEGEAAAGNVAGKLSEILGGVSKVTDIVSEIAAAAAEQTTGIARVNEAISGMDRVTQQNAASSEESSSAASELSSQAEELAAMVGTFRLGAGADDRAAPGHRTRIGPALTLSRPPPPEGCPPAAPGRRSAAASRW